MADLQNTQPSSAPGSLLRTVAETQAQDPSKIPQSSQPGSATRNLVQEPVESTLPQSTPRVLNVVGPQTANPDFSGLHAMLSSMPVPPPHVASGLIRAMMTPPSGVVAPRPYVPPAQIAPNNPSQSRQSNPQANNQGSSNPSPVRPVAPAIPSSNQATNNFMSGGSNNNQPQQSVFGQQTFRPAPQSQPAPQTRQNMVGFNPFIGGLINTGENLGSDVLSGIGSVLGGLNLSDFITNRLGLGGWFNPRQAS